MPQPGKVWRHVILGTKSSWLPADKCGWRSREHKRHSSGDYKRPPPVEEHEGLRRYVEDRAESVVKIPRHFRSRVGMEMLKQFTRRGIRVLCASVSEEHAHFLAELPNDLKSSKRIVGFCKGASSHAVRDVLPGHLWSEGAKFEFINDRSHHRNVYNYILYKQGRSAFTWSYRDATLGFVPGRKRPASRI